MSDSIRRLPLRSVDNLPTPQFPLKTKPIGIRLFSDDNIEDNEATPVELALYCNNKIPENKNVLLIQPKVVTPMSKQTPKGPKSAKIECTSPRYGKTGWFLWEK